MQGDNVTEPYADRRPARGGGRRGALGGALGDGRGQPTGLAVVPAVHHVGVAGRRPAAHHRQLVQVGRRWWAADARAAVALRGGAAVQPGRSGQFSYDRIYL